MNPHWLKLPADPYRIEPPGRRLSQCRIVAWVSTASVSGDRGTRQRPDAWMRC